MSTHLYPFRLIIYVDSIVYIAYEGSFHDFLGLSLSLLLKIKIVVCIVIIYIGSHELSSDKLLSCL